MASAEIESFRGRVLRELDRVVKALDGLDEEAVNWKPPSPSANTLLVLATHTLGAAEDHIVRQVAGKPIARSRDAEFAVHGSAAGIRARAAEVKSRIGDALEGFDPALLGDERDTPSGKRTARDLLVHAVAHASEHAGQAELTRDLYIAKRGST
ncbi:MAG: DinB family protein [Chloroflexi bacterium]|nr:MAG: DinB family protein [Chloroflexota bacterium]